MDQPTSRRAFLTTAATLTIGASAYAAGSDVIKIGMIGCGGRCTEGALQAMNADPGARLVAMADMVPARIREKREWLKQRKPDQVSVADDHCFAGFDAYKHVIEASDAVLIANAAKFHSMHMMAAIRAGRHV